MDRCQRLWHSKRNLPEVGIRPKEVHLTITRHREQKHTAQSVAGCPVAIETSRLRHCVQVCFLLLLLLWTPVTGVETGKGYTTAQGTQNARWEKTFASMTRTSRRIAMDLYIGYYTHTHTRAHIYMHKYIQMITLTYRHMYNTNPLLYIMHTFSNSRVIVEQVGNLFAARPRARFTIKAKSIIMS